jgi:hypothetical protein
LRVTLAVTGATMLLGCGVNHIKKDSIALWWQPVGIFADQDRDKMAVIFGDVTEVGGMTPDGKAFRPDKAEQADDFLRYALATVPGVRSTMAPDCVDFYSELDQAAAIAAEHWPYWYSAQEDICLSCQRGGPH